MQPRKRLSAKHARGRRAMERRKSKAPLLLSSFWRHSGSYFSTVSADLRTPGLWTGRTSRQRRGKGEDFLKQKGLYRAPVCGDRFTYRYTCAYASLYFVDVSLSTCLSLSAYLHTSLPRMSTHMLLDMPIHMPRTARSCHAADAALRWPREVRAWPHPPRRPLCA